MADWEISKAAGHCCGTGKPFEVGQEYYAALVEGEQNLERRDFSIEYWEQARPKVYCFWKTHMPDENRKKRLLVSDEMLMSFFERLAEETDVEKLNFRFVLALILMRKRKLKYESSENQNETEVWILRVTGENRFVNVVNPHLNEEQIDELSGQMGQILQVDL
ncbi:MAG: hypothetical protein JXA82_05465 [Sedimentisphaerales bacterium]|nr:hypothetical protein [Sedimentisphaerales bacterium]